jgi:hypothetical protein
MENKAAIEKRQRVILSEAESKVLKWLYVKTLIPMGMTILISSSVLYFGLRTLINKASFTNYGMAPTSSMNNVSKFISTYMIIAATNLVLVIALSAVVMYIVLHDLVMPIIRITREVKLCMETGKKGNITVRTTDRLLSPLVDLLNKLLGNH